MRKKTTLALRAIMLLQGALWIALAIIGFMEPAAGTAGAILAALMLANSAVFILLAFTLNNGSFILKLFTAAFILVNLILTITDQMGILDYCVLVLNVMLLIGYSYLRISGRKPKSAVSLLRDLQ